MLKEKLFLKVFIVFSLVGIIFFYVLNYWISPFNRRISSPILVDKYSIAKHYNTRLYNLNSFKLHPNKTIVLGDSRARRLVNKYWSTSISNMSYAGGTLREAIDTFYYLDKNYSINKIYFGLSIDLMNDRNHYNNTQLNQSISLSERNDFVYYLNWELVKASVSTIITYFKGDFLVPSVLKSGKSDFWTFQLSEAKMKSRYGLRKNEKKSMLLLKKFSKYCDDNNIEIVFFIPAVHSDLQDKMSVYGAQKEEAEFIEVLSSMGMVIDFNFKNKITIDSANFSDPFHFNEVFAKKHVDVLLHPKATEISHVFERTYLEKQ